MLTTLTKLDAINMILSAIGSDPVNALETDTDADVANALRLLEKSNRDIQRKGWDFNKGTYTFYPDAISKKIRWDDTIITFESSDSNTYVKRGEFLYDATNQTFLFKDKVELTVIIAVDFEDLPDCFKSYITAKTAMAFQFRYLGDTNISQQLLMEVEEAYQDIVSYDMNMGSYNMLQLTNIAEVLVRT